VLQRRLPISRDPYNQLAYDVFGMSESNLRTHLPKTCAEMDENITRDRPHPIFWSRPAPFPENEERPDP